VLRLFWINITDVCYDCLELPRRLVLQITGGWTLDSMQFPVYSLVTGLYNEYKPVTNEYTGSCINEYKPVINEYLGNCINEYKPVTNEYTGHCINEYKPVTNEYTGSCINEYRPVTNEYTGNCIESNNFLCTLWLLVYTH
jgi:hypothetical protein